MILIGLRDCAPSEALVIALGSVDIIVHFPLLALWVCLRYLGPF